MMRRQPGKLRKLLAKAPVEVHGRNAVLFHHSDVVFQEVEYDFSMAGDAFHFLTLRVIIFRRFQGGTAGAVVAFRPGENPDWKILVIEVGASYIPVPSN